MYVSTLEWGHNGLLEEYHYNSEKVVSLDSLRQLQEAVVTRSQEGRH
jgi:hypothetical protein